MAENPKLFLVSLGRSTGEVLRLVAANLGQRPLALRMNGLALEPVEGVTEQKLLKEMRDLGVTAPTNAIINFYSLNLRKPPPTANRIYRVAGLEKQRQAQRVPFILEASRRLRDAGALHPDSDPAEYCG